MAKKEAIRFMVALAIAGNSGVAYSPKNTQGERYDSHNRVELNVGEEPYVPSDTDEIVILTTHADGKVDKTQCHVGYDDNWRQCLSTIGDSTFNDARTSDQEWQIGQQKDGSAVEVWVMKKDGTKRKLDITNKKTILPAKPEGFAFEASEEKAKQIQPSEPEGSIVRLVDKDGNVFMCHYLPNIKPFVMILDNQGRWVGSENWSDGLYESSNPDMPTVSFNCNDEMDGTKLMSAQVNGHSYVVPRAKFKPTTLIGFRPVPRITRRK